MKDLASAVAANSAHSSPTLPQVPLPSESAKASPKGPPEGVHFWRQDDWNTHYELLRSVPKEQQDTAELKFGYLCKPDGTFVSSSHRGLITKHAYSVFRSMYHDGIDPEKWVRRTWILSNILPHR